MKKSGQLTNAFAILAGIFLFIEGVWGLSREHVFGTLTTNPVHAVIHILVGVTSIGLGLTQNARAFCIFLGVLFIAVGIMRFLPGIQVLVIRFLNVNKAVAYVNIIVGALSLIAAYSSRTPERKKI